LLVAARGAEELVVVAVASIRALNGVLEGEKYG
jgi:hypothetical protein